MSSRLDSIDDLWDFWRRGPVPAPRSLRDTFDVMSLYDPATGIDAFLERIDFEGVPPSHHYYTVLDRPPEHAKAIRVAGASHPRKRFKQALLSDEFQNKLVSLLLNAYPEKRRNLFLHIPKCAGTNLSTHLIPRYLSFARAIEAKQWTPKEKMLDWISGLSKVAQFFDEIFIYGHTFFGDYLRRVESRLDDNIFTVVRDPLDLMLSQANYNVGLIAKDPTARRPDTRRTMELLGIESRPDPFTDEELRDLALRGLLDHRIAQPNRICTYLGDGKADQSLLNLIARDVEVTDMRRYGQWIRERWGIESTKRHNESRPILTRQDTEAHLEVLLPRVAEDQIVYEEIQKVLEKTGKASLKGTQLA